MKFDSTLMLAIMAASASGAALPQGQGHPLEPKSAMPQGQGHPLEPKAAMPQGHSHPLEPKSAQDTKPFIGVEVPEGHEEESENEKRQFRFPRGDENIVNDFDGDVIFV